MKYIKSLKMMVLLAMSAFIVACGNDKKDEPKMKQIYGTYEGTATQIQIIPSTGEQAGSFTETATLTLSNNNKGMTVEIKGEKILSRVSNLPALEVTGTSSYQYSYTSNDGSVKISISSPDFNSISVNYSSTYAEDDRKFEITFTGLRK